MSEVPQGNLPKPASEKTPAPAAPAAPPRLAPAAVPAAQTWAASRGKPHWCSSLKSVYGPGILEAATLRAELSGGGPRHRHEVLSALRQQHGYHSLTDLTAVHYPKDALPFEMVWILYSMSDNWRGARKSALC